MNMKIKMIASTAAAITLFAGATQAETVLTMNSWLPPTHPQVSELFVPWAADIERVTEGRVKINMLPAPLGPPPAAFDLAKNGVADITYSVHGYTPGRFKTPMIAEMPFMSDSSVATSVAFWRVHEAMLEDAGEYEGVKVLTLFTHGPGEIFSARPIETPEDIAGQKIRIGSALAHSIASDLGAVPIEGPSSKAYELLSQGVADGIFFPYESVNFFNLNDILDYGYTVPGGLYNTAMFVVMNDAKWNSISPEDQALIEPLLGEAFARRAGEMWDKVDAEGRVSMEGKITLKVATESEVDELKTRLQPIVAERIAQVSETGIDGQAAYDMLFEEIAKIESEE
ncbi:TRAP transporter substrate-binding protein [Celeribacter sp. ULVN23_4]